MENLAYQEYSEEVQTWHKSGRLRLIHEVLQRHVPASHELEILEIGAGVGQNVETLTKFGTVDVAEINPLGLEALRTRKDIRRVLNAPVPFEVEKKYDLLCAFDVVEHLENDQQAVEWIFESLKPGGMFFATVPAYQWMFSEHDLTLQHFRRYTRSQIVGLASRHAEILQSGYFISLLFPLAVASRLKSIWAYRFGDSNGSASKSRSKQSAKVNPVLDRLFSMTLEAEVRLIRHGLRLPMGLSTFVMAKKPS